MPVCLLYVALLLAPGVLAAADFEAAMTAYEDQNYTIAVQEFSVLAEEGDRNAQYMLGRLYARGRGVLQNYIEAHKWFNLAASQGHTQAPAARDEVGGLMTAEQIARAQALAQAWLSGESAENVEAAGTASAEPSEGLVGRIQVALNKLGYNAGTVNGKLSQQTRTAISDYQMDHMIPVDGRASQALLEHLSGAAAAPLIARGRDTAGPEPVWEWRRVVLRDGFRDGNFNADPAWTVAAGRFWIESRSGLRSAAAGNNKRVDQPNYAEIYIDEPINNAFAIRLKLSSRQRGGLLEFGPYQDANRASGYRLFYTPDNPGRFGIRRLARGGANVYMSKRRFRLEDGNEHTLLWTRDANGHMVVSLDGNELLRVTDTAFENDFEGFTFINRGGDFGLREISIHGAG